jgi:hypothetical protein
LSDDTPIDVEVDEQFATEMATYDRRLARAQLAQRQFEAIVASERMEGAMQGGNAQGGNAQGGNAAIDSDSELSTVSCQKFLGLDDNWWKELEKGQELEKG